MRKHDFTFFSLRNYTVPSIATNYKTCKLICLINGLDVMSEFLMTNAWKDHKSYMSFKITIELECRLNANLEHLLNRGRVIKATLFNIARCNLLSS